MIPAREMEIPLILFREEGEILMARALAMPPGGARDDAIEGARAAIAILEDGLSLLSPEERDALPAYDESTSVIERR